MRCYLIEDIKGPELEKIRAALVEKGYSGGLDDIFYLPLPEALLSDVQLAHAAECGPHVCVLEVLYDEVTEEGALKLELLVRARGKLRCECVLYASSEQRAHMMNLLDDIIRQQDIAV